MKRALIITVIVALVLYLVISSLPSRKAAKDNLTYGMMYEYGIGVDTDASKALQRYLDAARAGLPEAQYAVGVLYENGSGVERNLFEAIRWYRLSADQGFPPALFNLANAYRLGSGVGRDFAKALSLYESAGKLGYAPAFHNLGAMYGNGEGTAQNYAEAYRWLLLSSKMGYVPATTYAQSFVKDLAAGEKLKAEQAAEALFQTVPTFTTPTLPGLGGFQP